MFQNYILADVVMKAIFSTLSKIHQLVDLVIGGSQHKEAVQDHFGVWPLGKLICHTSNISDL